MADLVLGVIGTVLAGAIAVGSRGAWDWLRTKRPIARRTHGLRLVLHVGPSAVAAIPAELRDSYLPHLLDDGPAYYLSAEKLKQMPTNYVPPESPETWAIKNGAEDVGETVALLIIQSTRSRAVAIHPPRVTRERSDPRSGAILVPQGLGGGGVPMRCFDIDLDPDEPAITMLDEHGERPSSLLVPLAAHESTAILVIAHATSDRHEWRLVLPCEVDGATVELTPDGPAMVTVGGQGVQPVVWAGDEWYYPKPLDG